MLTCQLYYMIFIVFNPINDRLYFILDHICIIHIYRLLIYYLYTLLSPILAEYKVLLMIRITVAVVPSFQLGLLYSITKTDNQRTKTTDQSIVSKIYFEAANLRNSSSHCLKLSTKNRLISFSINSSV